MKKNIIVGQSGGPSSAINSSLAGVIKQAMRSEEIGEIYGMLHGIEGLLKRDIINLRGNFKDACDYDRLAATPTMALGSCRYKTKPAEYEEILKILKDYDISVFFYIGGNDSMDTVMQLSQYFASKGESIRCVGVPKTIDNDLPRTDHTPGFASAAKYVAASISEIMLDMSVYNAPSVTVVEIMGRDAGWLTAASVLARDSGCGAPHLIYLPEVPFDPGAFIAKVKEVCAKNRTVVIAVSEGIKNKDGEYVSTAGAARDAFGHVKLSGAGRYLESLLKDQLDCKVRSIEFSVLQRCAAHYASATDIAEAMTAGEQGVLAALRGETGVMMAYERVSDNPYLVRYISVPIEECANLEKKIPSEWIIDGCDVSDKILPYLRPLVKGRANTFEKDGAPSYMWLDKTVIKK